MSTNLHSNILRGLLSARPAANTLVQGALYYATDQYKIYQGTGPTNTWGDYTDAFLTAIAAGSISTTELGGDITAFAKTLLDDANAAAARTTLGLGTAAVASLDTDATMAANSNTAVPSQAAVRSYVGDLLNGLQWKHPVRAATAAAGTLASSFENGDTVDGVVLATGDRILIKDQAAPAENGIYTVAASGAPTRGPDADLGAELPSATVMVREGTANADTQWTCTANGPVTLGSTALPWVETTGSGGAATLDALSDVDLTGEADGDVLTRVAGVWRPQAPAGGASLTTLYFPGKNSAAHADDRNFNAAPSGWTDVNWSEQAVADYNTTVPGALYIEHPISAVSGRLRAKVDAIPAGDWTKVLDFSPSVRNHGGLAMGMVVGQSAVAGSGNMSIFGVSISSGLAYCYVFGYSFFTTFNGPQVSQSGWGFGPRVLLRWNRASGVDTVQWGTLDPYTGVMWSNPISPAWYGSLTHYGIVYQTVNGGEPISLAFHDFLHYPTSYPAGGYGIPRSVHYT